MAALQHRCVVVRGPGALAGPRGSGWRQESEARARGEPGSPKAQVPGAGGLARGSVPQPHHPLGPGRGHSSAPKHQPARLHGGKWPHAGGFMAKVPEPPLQQPDTRMAWPEGN